MTIDELKGVYYDFFINDADEDKEIELVNSLIDQAAQIAREEYKKELVEKLDAQIGYNSAIEKAKKLIQGE